eukprot:3744680-Prymnesium_polylepis.1
MKPLDHLRLARAAPRDERTRGALHSRGSAKLERISGAQQEARRQLVVSEATQSLLPRLCWLGRGLEVAPHGNLGRCRRCERNVYVALAEGQSAGRRANIGLPSVVVWPAGVALRPRPTRKARVVFM